jgi:beta-N-acetylhexosaminidase
MASSATYGHTGFTGTVVWVDPTQDLIFIMLSNRVYPTVNNRKLAQLKIRRRMHEAVYNSIIYS